jgi:hypothetical protein
MLSVLNSTGRFSSRRTSLAAKVLEDNSGERDF